MHPLVEQDPRYRAAKAATAKAANAAARYLAQEEKLQARNKLERAEARRRFTDDDEASVDELVAPYAPKDPESMQELATARINAMGNERTVLAEVARDVLPALAQEERKVLAFFRAAAAELREPLAEAELLRSTAAQLRTAAGLPELAPMRLSVGALLELATSGGSLLAAPGPALSNRPPLIEVGRDADVARPAAGRELAPDTRLQGRR